MASYVQMPVGQLVCERPQRARVLERLGIDYCCGGRRSLAEACQQRGLDVKLVCRQLEAEEAASQEQAEQVDWSAASLSALIEHILQAHHGYLRRELPRLQRLLAQVLAAHGGRHPELRELEEVFAHLEDELRSHMLKEEQVLFPWIMRMEGLPNPAQPVRVSVRPPIAVLEDEHQRAGEGLARMRWLTRGYTAPRDACPTYRALLAGLAELEADLHQHIHKENNILFPRTMKMEAPNSMA